MDSELEVDTESEIKEGGENATLLFTYLDELFPYYLLYGMTYEQYWEMDSALAISYRKKHELEMQQQNQMLWLQGAYFYNALGSIAPMFNAMASDHTPKPYVKEPFPLSEQERVEQEQREQGEKVKEYMMQFMTKFNNSIGEEGEYGN